jgi:hypothetical protein
MLFPGLCSCTPSCVCCVSFVAMGSSSRLRARIRDSSSLDVMGWSLLPSCVPDLSLLSGADTEEPKPVFFFPNLNL